MPRGGNSQDRRRARRASVRSEVLGPEGAPGSTSSATILSVDEYAELDTLAASALADPDLEAEPDPDLILVLVEEEAAVDPDADGDDDTGCDCAGEPGCECDQEEAAATATASFRLTFPDEALQEAAALLAARAVIVPDADVPESEIAPAVLERFQLVFTDTFDAAALPPEHEPGATLPEAHPSPAAPEVADLARGPKAWTAIFVPEGKLTDDGRAMAPGAIKWRELPLTLMGLNETSAEGGHDGAVACGRIDNVWRAENGLIMAQGVFADDEVGAYYATAVENKVIRGVSVDLAIHEYEVGPRSDYFDADGNWLTEKPEAAVEAEEPADLLDILFGEDQTEQAIFVVTDAIIGMCTVCPFPAFADARIELGNSITAGANPGIVTVTAEAAFLVSDRELEESEIVTEPEPALVAGGVAPVNPPADWFLMEEPDELTPLTITDDGRVYGHAWAWDSCHTAFSGVCVLPPRTETDYAYYHLGEVACENGERIPVGKVTFNTGHADRRLGRRDATAHYDHTGAVGAYVRIVDGELGGWFCGVVHPDLTAEQLSTFRGAVPSGDWRDYNGHLELVALLEVNVPGFPVPRAPLALVASAEDGLPHVVSLQAAGIHAGPDTPLLSGDEKAKLEALADLALGIYDDIDVNDSVYDTDEA